MRGTRDSEIAAMIKDLETVDSMMNGVPVKVPKFAHTMRMRLWKIHLGIEDKQMRILEWCQFNMDVP